MMLYLILAVDIEGKDDTLIVSANMVDRIMDRLWMNEQCVFCAALPLGATAETSVTDVPSIMRPQAGDIWKRH